MFDIKHPTSAFLRFYEEWKSENDYITAYTSGSTGTPKEIHLPKSDLKASAKSTNDFFNINSSSILYCPLSADYISGKMMLVRALEADCTLMTETPSNNILVNPGNLPQLDLIAIVPSQIESLIDAIGRSVVVRNVIVGGAPMTVRQEQMLWGINAYATYGMTETCSHVALRKIGESDYRALRGISFESDADKRLIIHADDRSFRVLHTNDIIELVSSTAFRWKGRADNVVNSGGVKLYPEEIERQLSGVLDFPFFIASEPHEKWGEQLILVIQNDNFSESYLRHQICETLPPYSVPKKIYTLGRIPLTYNGKINRIEAMEMIKNNKDSLSRL